LITDAARQDMATHLESTYTKARVGVGGNNSSPIASNLDVPIFDVSAVVSSKSDENVVDFKFTIAGASIAGYTIRELGIFNSDYSKMLTRVNFEGVGPFSTEDVDFFVTLEVE
jgi:hypothetical protein